MPRSALLALPLVALACLAAVRAEAQTRRLQLDILVISDDDVGTDMVKAGLDEALVPYTEVALGDPTRPRIDETFLIDQRVPSVRTARFQGVVLPTRAPTGLSLQELTALERFEREFHVRQLDAYVYPSPTVGLRSPEWPGYAGSLDGLTAEITDAARAAGFGYLKGPVPFEDLDRAVCESYGYLAAPRAGSFTPFLEAPVPGSSEPGVLLGVYEESGREELVLTAAMNRHQLVQQLLFPGLLTWLTRGVHLGSERNFIAVHIDDIFLTDSRWLMEGDCTHGDLACTPEVPVPDIVMTPEDVDFLVSWQRRQQLKLDLVYNGYGYDEAMALHGSFPLGDALLARKDELRWISHTYSHQYLGCIQDFSHLPWRCEQDEARMTVRWTPYEAIHRELTENIRFARRMGLAIDTNELVTGEHSGLRRAPLEPSDNPNFARALSDLGIAWIGSDNSRESAQRPLGGGLTVPRYPMNIFYNVGTQSEEVDLYNWLYNSSADGGSGVCEVDETSTCIAPLDGQRGFFGYIVPQQARALLLHTLENSPRPHYAHQSNLAEERILYPVIDRMLDAYRGLFAENMPLVNATLAELGREFERRARWRREHHELEAYVEQGTLVLRGDGGRLVPLTVPGPGPGLTLSPYGTGASGWQAIDGTLRVALPDSAHGP